LAREYKNQHKNNEDVLANNYHFDASHIVIYPVWDRNYGNQKDRSIAY